MVVPLKLTQFYGHSVPRPRIYPDVKFNDQRVDPPPSVNDALLSWASDAHWSMGGLSSKRLRTQGKVEGNVRRLRAFVEEDEEENVSGKVKAPVKGLKKPVAAEAVTSSMRKEASRSVEKRKHGLEESVEVTPAKKLRRKEIVEESAGEESPARKLRRREIVEESGEESPMFVPATEERSQRRGQARSMFASRGVSSGDVMKKVPRSPLKEAVLEDTPATGGRRKGKLSSASTRSLRGSKESTFAASRNPEGSPASDDGRLTRSAKMHSKKASRARKVLMASDVESSDSDDGLEAFLQEKGRSLRRSTRLVKTEEGKSLSGSDSD